MGFGVVELAVVGVNAIPEDILLDVGYSIIEWNWVALM